MHVPSTRLSATQSFPGVGAAELMSGMWIQALELPQGWLGLEQPGQHSATNTATTNSIMLCAFTIHLQEQLCVCESWQWTLHADVCVSLAVGYMQAWQPGCVSIRVCAITSSQGDYAAAMAILSIAGRHRVCVMCESMHNSVRLLASVEHQAMQQALWHVHMWPATCPTSQSNTSHMLLSAWVSLQVRRFCGVRQLSQLGRSHACDASGGFASSRLAIGSCHVTAAPYCVGADIELHTCCCEQAKLCVYTQNKGPQAGGCWCSFIAGAVSKLKV